MISITSVTLSTEQLAIKMSQLAVFFTSVVVASAEETAVVNPPVFGHGHDLHISDNANSNTGSYTGFGASYALPSGVQDSSTILAGTYKFTPGEVEVLYLG